jgi:hypothetical protein
MAEKAIISSKHHLEYLEMNYTASGHTMGTGGGEAEQQQQQSVIEEVLEKLCPPACIENLTLKGGYVGRQLPNWMSAPASADFKSLRYLTLENLPCSVLPPKFGIAGHHRCTSHQAYWPPIPSIILLGCWSFCCQYISTVSQTERAESKWSMWMGGVGMERL